MKKYFLAIFVVLLAIGANADSKVVEEIVKVQVTEKGFEPSTIKVKSGSHVVLQVTRSTEATCATQIQVKKKKIKKDLPLNKEVKIDLGVIKKGEVRFACGMNMFTGQVIAE